MFYLISEMRQKNSTCEILSGLPWGHNAVSRLRQRDASKESRTRLNWRRQSGGPWSTRDEKARDGKGEREGEREGGGGKTAIGRE